MRASRFSSFAVHAALAALVTSLLVGCGGPEGAKSGGRDPLAEKWLTRAQVSFRAGDFEDARDAAKSALQAAPRDPDVRMMNARIALTRLEYDETLKLTEGMATSESHALRGRAYWYRGDLEQAADELEAMLTDPTVKDNWAHEVAGLARRGVGRHPFAIEGGLIGSVEMPPAGPALVVPCELEGEQVLAMIATATGEVVVDSNTRKEAAWVNLRFGDHMEVKDVPALTQDLSGLSRQMGAPIKLLIGVNLLRHTHATFDRRGDKFIVRKGEPTAPPQGTRVPLWYVRGGGMLVRAGVAANDRSAMLIDTSSMFPIGLDDALWKRAGIDLAKLTPAPGAANVKEGTIPMLKFAGFDLPQIPAVQGEPLAELKSNMDVELGGIIGAGLLSLFRVTFGDEGRFLWLEADPSLLAPAGRGVGDPTRPADPAIAPGSPKPGDAPKPSGAAKPSDPAKPAAAPKPATTPKPAAAKGGKP